MWISYTCLVFSMSQGLTKKEHGPMTEAAQAYVRGTTSMAEAARAYSRDCTGMTDTLGTVAGTHHNSRLAKYTDSKASVSTSLLCALA